MESIKNSLFSSPLLKVLDVFLTHGNQVFTDREVFELIENAKYASIHQSLQKLAQLNITTRERKEKYITNKLNVLPWLSHLKIVSNLLEIDPFVEKLKPLSSKIILFGSRAQGTQHAGSDFDLFVISSQKENIHRCAAQEKNSEKIQCLVKTPAEALTFFENELVLAQEIRKGIILWET